jgi:alpha-galactosidase
MVGWGPKLHATGLTPDEQYLHITLWSLVASPLLIGCDMTQLDPFTLSLLTNDEVLAVNQDMLGKQASRVSKNGNLEVWARPLADGTWAVGLLNFSAQPADVSVKFDDLKLSGKQHVRDLWRQQDAGDADGEYSMKVYPHGAEMVKIGTPKAE